MAESGERSGGGGGRSTVDNRILNGIALVTTLVWAASFVADVVMPAYSAPIGIHSAFLAVLGGVFGFRLVGRE